MYVLRGGGRGGEGRQGTWERGRGRREGGEGKRAANYHGIEPMDSETGIPVGLRSVRTEGRREGWGEGGRGRGGRGGGGEGGEEGGEGKRADNYHGIGPMDRGRGGERGIKLCSVT